MEQEDSSSVATRPAAAATPACARPSPTTPTSAPNTASPSTSERTCPSAVGPGGTGGPEGVASDVDVAHSLVSVVYVAVINVCVS